MWHSHNESHVISGRSGLIIIGFMLMNSIIWDLPRYFALCGQHSRQTEDEDDIYDMTCLKQTLENNRRRGLCTM